MGEVGMLAGESKDSSFDQRALNIVVFDHHIFLERFDGKELSLTFQFGEQDLQRETNDDIFSDVWGGEIQNTQVLRSGNASSNESWLKTLFYT